MSEAATLPTVPQPQSIILLERLLWRKTKFTAVRIHQAYHQHIFKKGTYFV